MEIEDLMAGDYVYNDKKQICKVCSINAIGIPYAEADNLAIDDGCFTLLYDYSGIPLTAEILEKNDFYYGYTSDEEDLASNTIAHLSEDDKGWCWDEGGGAIKVIFPNETDGGMLVIDDQSFDRHFVMMFSETIFLHEFQYALRLCGIKKEIVL